MVRSNTMSVEHPTPTSKYLTSLSCFIVQQFIEMQCVNRVSVILTRPTQILIYCMRNVILYYIIHRFVLKLFKSISEPDLALVLLLVQRLSIDSNSFIEKKNGRKRKTETIIIILSTQSFPDKLPGYCEQYSYLYYIRVVCIVFMSVFPYGVYLHIAHRTRALNSTLIIREESLVLLFTFDFIGILKREPWPSFIPET